MKIIEARDGFINFEADESVYLSSFIQAAGMDKTYVAQVNQMKKFGKILIASARILFLYKDNELLDYDRTLPSKDSELTIFPTEAIQSTIKFQKPVLLGKTLDNSKNIFMDLSAFKKKTLISIDNNPANNILINNLSKQFEHLGQNTIIIDTLGIVNGTKYFAGKDFKLPLDSSTLEFMFKSCLNDATADSKATIAEVFADISEYSKTVPFVPFGVLKSIVDDMVDKQHIFKLFVLKNRLANFAGLGYFATDIKEVESIDTILKSKSAVIDLSKLNPLFQNRFLEYLYSKIDTQNIQVILETSNTVSKKNLKTIIVDSEVSTTLVAHSKYQYLSDIKDMFKNFVIEPTVSNNEVFKVYCTFLSSMESGMYLIAGEGINFIPMVSKIQEIDEFIENVSEEKFVEEIQDSADINEHTNDEAENESVDQEETIDEAVNESFEQEEMTDETTEFEEDLEQDLLEALDDSSQNEKEEVEDTVEEEVLTQEEIIAEIDEKSKKVIDNITEGLEENSTELDLFNDEEDSDEDVETEIDDSESMEEYSENSEEAEVDDILPSSLEDETILTDDSEPEENIIEPEYSEVTQPQNSDTDEAAFDIPEEEPLEIISDNENISEDVIDIEEEYSAEELEQNENTEKPKENEVKPEDLLLDDDSDDVLGNIAEDEEGTLSDESPSINEESEEDILSAETEELETNDFSEEDLSIELSSEEELLIDESEMVEEENEEDKSIEPENSFIEPSLMPLDGSEYDQNYEEEPEEFISADDIKEDDIIIDMTDENDGSIDEEVDRQIVEDVDKVFTTMKNEEELEEISDSDLDLIDALNSDEEELEEYQGELEEVSDVQVDEGILEQPSEGIVPQRQHSQQSENDEILERKEANTPIVPVYDADIPQEDLVVSDAIQQGDSVVHAKYGNGVVEKMIKYGTKTLFSINFENVGRRLLDPTLTEIKKL